MVRTPETPKGYICVGVIIGPYGVKGGVRVKTFTAEPSGVAAYGPVSDETGSQSFEVTVVGKFKSGVNVMLSGVSDRDTAESLKGTHLYVERDKLPEPDEDEFYHSDLVGLPAEWPDGSAFGIVRGLNDYGAGDVIELDTVDGKPVVLPFTHAAVPEIDLAGGRIVVDPPEGLVSSAKQDDGLEGPGK
ncbi:MAG: ribosome maturation factor RimM [Proteobacteria bacterium]|nr:ribosome maturation factor RimM [Pseudomonadota bacterium]